MYKVCNYTIKLTIEKGFYQVAFHRKDPFHVILQLDGMGEESLQQHSSGQFYFTGRRLDVLFFQP